MGEAGITTPFPIQQRTLPDSLAGRDVLGRGQTGSGKTSSTGRARREGDDRRRSGEDTGEKGIPYPEWDYREGRHKRNWAWVQEKTLAESNLAEAQRLGDRRFRRQRHVDRVRSGL